MYLVFKRLYSFLILSLVIVTKKNYVDWLGVHVKKLDLVSLYQLHPMQLLDQDRLKQKRDISNHPIQ